MCGITGWVEWKKDLTHFPSILEAMTETLAERGPDASGTWMTRHCAFGHRRLCVIDPEGYVVASMAGEGHAEGLARLIRALGTVIGGIMAIGAVFGALNTMYAAVAGRAREIATLRAIGFRGLPVVTGVMLETMLLALLGGALGGGVAWLLFNGYSAATLGANFSQVMFEFRVTPGLLWTGLKWALGIGLVGGLFPALRAARLPVTEALRSA